MIAAIRFARPAAAVLAGMTLVQCAAGSVASSGTGGSGGHGGVTPLLSVGGTYSTMVSLISNSCPTPTIEDHTTTVNHTPGETSLTLTHAGTTYSGTIQPDARFATSPKTLAGVYTVTIVGQFSVSAMDAGVTVEDGSQSCAYRVRWQGPKQGAANVIP